MSMSDPLNHLGSILYHPESLEIPYSQTSNWSQTFFAIYYSKAALAKVLQSNLYTVPEVEVHNGKVSCFCGKHFLVFIDISFFSGNISPFFCKNTIIHVLIRNWKKKNAYLIHKT